MTIKDASTIAGTWVAIGSAILGGYFAVSEFMARGEDARKQNEKRIDERVLQTFQMYEAFHRGDLLARRAGFGSVGPDDPALDVWINYFDTVQACVEAKLCDQGLVDQLFKPYARASLGEVGCRIIGVRELEKDYGLPREQGYGLLKVAGVEAPECKPEPVVAAATTDVKPAVKKAEPVKAATEAAAPAATPEPARSPAPGGPSDAAARGASPTAGRGGRGSLGAEPAPGTVVRGDTGRGGRGSSASAPATPGDTTPERGQGN